MHYPEVVSVTLHVMLRVCLPAGAPARDLPPIPEDFHVPRPCDMANGSELSPQDVRSVVQHDWLDENMLFFKLLTCVVANEPNGFEGKTRSE